MKVQFNRNDSSSTSSGIGSLYWLFAVVYAFMQWGFWWGILNIFIPFAPMVDLVKYLQKHA